MLNEEDKSRKIVLFYIIYTCVYFPILLSLIFWSKGISIVGKYSFQSILVMIIVAETTKYLVSSFHFLRYDYNLTKKVDNSTLSALSRFFCSRSKVKEGAKTIFFVTIMIFVIFMVAILFGAEIFDKHEETFMFSALMSILTVFPACLNQGAQFVCSTMLGSKPTNILDVLMTQNLHLTFIGAWLGAIVIPLDWDRPWQVWPIPCSLGAMAGFVCSHVVMFRRLSTEKGKKGK